MIFPRTKLIIKFGELIATTEKQYINIAGGAGVGKTTFLGLLQSSETLSGYSVESIFITSISPLTSTVLSDPDIDLLIIDSDVSLSISDIRAFIISYPSIPRVIFTSEISTEQDDVENFVISGISLREYSEGMGTPIDVGSVMSGTAPIDTLNTLRDGYIHLGAYGVNISDPTHREAFFQSKISIINQELFKKEEGDFLEFVRTLAMGVGDIFKEDRIAKMMNISRRKVRKYTELLLTHKMIRAIGPWVEHPETELSRHVKLYFTDLAYLATALGVSYYHGEGKQGVIENMISIELDRKLSITHDIRFYRKKSGAEVSFLLIEKSTGQITPIEVTTRSTDIIPPSLKIFYETYSDRIDHMMITNDTIASKKDISGTPVIILPHIAI